MKIKPRTVYEFAWNDFILSPEFIGFYCCSSLAAAAHCLSPASPVLAKCSRRLAFHLRSFLSPLIPNHPRNSIDLVAEYAWPQDWTFRTMSIDEVALINNYKKTYSRMFGFVFRSLWSAISISCPFILTLSIRFAHARDAHTGTQPHSPLKCLGKNSISFDSLRFQVISMGFYSFL